MSMVLASIEARFRAPARLDDMLFVAADVSEVGGARIVFGQSVRRGRPDGELLCEAIAEVACIDTAHNKPRRMPAALMEEWKG
jgi:4-hydroxybenzoyl-CoA thioesterase